MAHTGVAGLKVSFEPLPEKREIDFVSIGMRGQDNKEGSQKHQAKDAKP